MDDFDAAVSASLLGAPPPAPMAPSTAARYGMQQAVGTNGDLEAELQRVSAQTGVPISTVRAQPEEAKRQATLDGIDFDQLATVAPSTARLLADVEKAKVSHDDVGTLATIEQGLRSLGSAAIDVGKYAASAPGAPGGGLLSDVAKAVRAIASGAPQAGAGLYGLAAAPFELLGMDRFGGFLREQQGSANAVAARVSPPNPSAGLIERGIMSGLQSGGQNLLMLPLGIFGGEAAMLGSMGGVTFGQTYGKARDAGLSPARAVPYAVQDAVAEVVTEKYLGAAGFLKNVQAGASAGKLFMYELAKEVPGEMAATLWQNFNEWANVNPSKTVGDFISEQPAALAETVIATLVGGTTQIGAVKATERALGRTNVDAQAAQHADAQSQALAAIMQAAAASKVRERDAATFEGFMQSATEDGPVEKLFINPRELEKAGIDLTQLAEVAPSAAQDYHQAMETGQDIAVPTSELMTRLPGSALEQSLLQHLKTDPGGFSRLGAQQYMQTQAETQRAEVEKVLAAHEGDTAFKDSMRAVEANVMQQLHAANRFTDDVNAPYAAMWGAFFGVQAARVGATPQELFDRFAPRIVAQTEGAAGALDQKSTAEAAPAPQQAQRAEQADKHEAVLQSLLECLGGT